MKSRKKGCPHFIIQSVHLVTSPMYVRILLERFPRLYLPAALLLVYVFCSGVRQNPSACRRAASSCTTALDIAICLSLCGPGSQRPGLSLATLRPAPPFFRSR